MFTIIRDAGWPIWPLLIASILTLGLIIERAWSLRRNQVLPPQLTDEVLLVMNTHAVNAQTLERLHRHSPLGQILAAGLEKISGSATDIANSMEESARRVAHELERYLNALGTIASVAPLLGLFGTVIGMIEIFAHQDNSSGAPAALAHGISVALYNTAFGLLVAIPALIFWRIFRRRVDQLLIELEAQAARFLKNAKKPEST
ncbi:MAG: MotA/TolQ/ExbB proton channel family protein [Ottowia sp.]|nr:MotA/TolQ/ExbB proton channel family protein [Ottowia sp.]